MNELDQNGIKPQGGRRPSGATWLVFAFIIAAHAAFQVLLNPIGTSADAIAVWLGLGLMGILISEPVLFGVWAGLGPGRLVIRLPVTYVILITLILTSVVKRWNVWWTKNESHSLEAHDLLWVSGFFVLATGMMLLARKILGWRITPNIEPLAEANVGQFSVKFLLGMTALCALLLSIGRGLSTADANFAVFAGLMLLILVPVLVLPFVVLSLRASWPLVVVAPLLWAMLTWLGIEAMVALEGRPRSEVAVQLVSLQAGAAIASLTAAIPLRLVGFRFVRHAHNRSSRHAAQAVETSHD